MYNNVSIHAPVWGATRLRPVSGTARQFQSTLPYGERPTSRFLGPTTESFNPRSRMGSDRSSSVSVADVKQFQSTLPYGERRGVQEEFAAMTSVSIHAPVWGATMARWIRSHIRRFQSTLPYGERQIGFDGYNSVKTSFNPRSRMGSDSTFLLFGLLGIVSIHAPVWGATA